MQSAVEQKNISSVNLRLTLEGTYFINKHLAVFVKNGFIWRSWDV